MTGPAQLLQYLISNFLLYLRVSGLFHLVVGMLHLFGFDLPETHKRYLLAASFTDFWRRINIYWKDFMQKVFYFPAAARLLVYRTASRLTTTRSIALDAAITKLFVSESLVRTALDAVQLHGGYGFMEDYEVERALRDAIGSTLYSGTSEMQRNIIGRWLGL